MNTAAAGRALLENDGVRAALAMRPHPRAGEFWKNGKLGGRPKRAVK